MSRAGIFAKIKTAVTTGDDQARRKAVEARLAAPPAHPLPERARSTGANARTAFLSHCETVGTVLFEVADAAGVPLAVAKFVANLGLGNTVTKGSDPWLAALPWNKAPSISLATWKPGTPPLIALSRASAGISESGTMVLASGPDNPASLNYLPDVHIVVLEAANLKGNMEAAIALARQSPGPRGMPRTLALVSSASRTADVGGKLVRGAHGPKRLAIILVG